MPKLKLDNPFFRAMGRLGDIVILNLAWVLCCLPVVTAGAATAGNAFALTARYEYRPARVILDGALLALKSPLSALVTAAMALWLPLLLLYDPMTALYLLFPWLLVGGAVWALALSAALLPAFRRLEEKKGEN